MHNTTYTNSTTTNTHLVTQNYYHNSVLSQTHVSNNQNIGYGIGVWLRRSANYLYNMFFAPSRQEKRLLRQQKIAQKAMLATSSSSITALEKELRELMQQKNFTDQAAADIINNYFNNAKPFERQGKYLEQRKTAVLKLLREISPESRSIFTDRYQNIKNLVPALNNDEPMIVKQLPGKIITFAKDTYGDKFVRIAYICTDNGVDSKIVSKNKAGRLEIYGYFEGQYCTKAFDESSDPDITEFLKRQKIS